MIQHDPATCGGPTECTECALEFAKKYAPQEDKNRRIERTIVNGLEFLAEPLTDELWKEAMPLLVNHWREIAHYQDIMLDPDIEVYRRMFETGMLRVFTARHEGNHKLHGYAVFFVRPNPHYRGSIQAVQDVLYIDPESRGSTGYRFIKWCDDKLAAERVQAVYHHVKTAHNFGKMLERIGYEQVDLIYARRLDK